MKQCWFLGISNLHMNFPLLQLRRPAHAENLVVQSDMVIQSVPRGNPFQISKNRRCGGYSIVCT